MKKLLAIIAISIAALNSNAQTEAGKIILGGAVQYNSSKNKGPESKISALFIAPNVGYFVADNLAIGISIGYQWGKNEQDVEQVGYQNYRIHNRAWNISPYVRHYTAFSEQFRFFAQLSGSYNYNKMETNANPSGTPVSQKSNTFIAQLSPGLAFFPSKRFGIEFALTGISYSHDKIKGLPFAEESSSNNFGVSLNATSPRIGLQYYF